MKVTSFLSRQHREVAAFLSALESERHVRAALLGEVAEELAAHLAAEQEVFYPRVRAKLRDDFGAVRRRSDLEALRTLLAELIATNDDGALFQEKAHALRELFLRHSIEAEEHLHPKVDAVLGNDELLELGVACESAAHHAAEDYRRRSDDETKGIGAAVPRASERT